MADFTATLKTLEQQRRQLLEEVAAIDRAMAALKGADRPGRWLPEEGTQPRTAPPASRVRKKRAFTLSEEHKRKLLEGQRRAREKRRGAASDSGSALTGSNETGLPRLVKRDAGSSGQP